MSLVPLLPIAGIAAASLAREAVGAVRDGLSFAAELVRPGSQDESKIESPLTDARDQFAAGLRQFAARLKQRLAAAGRKVTGAMELAADGLGGIEVRGGQDAKLAVEKIIADDSTLLDQFHALAERYAKLTDGSRSDFGVLIEGDAAEVIAPKH